MPTLSPSEEGFDILPLDVSGLPYNSQSYDHNDPTTSFMIELNKIHEQQGFYSSRIEMARSVSSEYDKNIKVFL